MQRNVEIEVEQEIYEVATAFNKAQEKLTTMLYDLTPQEWLVKNTLHLKEVYFNHEMNHRNRSFFTFTFEARYESEVST
jgi:hypothetical protein